MKVVHGLSIPVGKLGYRLPRTFSSAPRSQSLSLDRGEPEIPFRVVNRAQNKGPILHGLRDRPRSEQGDREEPERSVFRIGGSIIRPTTPQQSTPLEGLPAQALPAATNDSPGTPSSKQVFEERRDIAYPIQHA